MADQKISQMDAVLTVGPDDLIMIVQNNVNCKLKASVFSSKFNGVALATGFYKHNTKNTLNSGATLPVDKAVNILNAALNGSQALPNGVDGQELYIVSKSTNTIIVTPATALGYTNLTFNAVGQTAVLVYFDTIGWTIKCLNGASKA